MNKIVFSVKLAPNLDVGLRTLLQTVDKSDFVKKHFPQGTDSYTHLHNVLDDTCADGMQNYHDLRQNFRRWFSFTKAGREIHSRNTATLSLSNFVAATIFHKRVYEESTISLALLDELKRTPEDRYQSHKTNEEQRRLQDLNHMRDFARAAQLIASQVMPLTAEYRRPSLIAPICAERIDKYLQVFHAN